MEGRIIKAIAGFYYVHNGAEEFSEIRELSLWLEILQKLKYWTVRIRRVI